MMIKLVEAFDSYQGEGYNFGMPAYFIRLADCNFNCPWCDTDWKKAKYIYQSFEEMFECLELDKLSHKNIILTGGEPTKNWDVFKHLVINLQNKGFKVHIETNGSKEIVSMKDIPEGIWISTSPKIIYKALYDKIGLIRKANEVRIVIDPKLRINQQIEAIKYFKEKIVADYYYLSPCEVNGKFNFDKLMKIYPKVKEDGWNISIQLHKIMNFR